MHADLRSLLSLTTECATAEQYEQARTEWLQRVVGFDTLYFGAAFRDAPIAHATSGVDTRVVRSCESNSDRYWPDRVRLNRGVVARGGVAVDVDLLPATTRSAMPLYDEVMTSLGIRIVAAAVCALRGRPSACLYLGRTLGGAFGAGLELLREALPILALGAEVHATRVSLPMSSRLSAREREIVDYLCLGLTNAEIATAMGTSPNTVKNQVASVLRKAEVANRTELAAAITGRPPTPPSA